MIAQLDFLRSMTSWSVLFRLTLAMIFGGIIGLERGRKRRAAGFRTYMMVCMGATLAMLLGQFEAELIKSAWETVANEVGIRTDVSRFGAQVINGVGFLGAGTIIVTGKQEIKGLTTAAGLWASACMGLAIGAGFYECVFLAFLLIILSIQFLPVVENFVIKNARNMNIYIEFRTLADMESIIDKIKSLDLQIYDIDLNRGEEGRYHSAVFSIRLKQRQSHTKVLALLSDLNIVRAIDEI